MDLAYLTGAVLCFGYGIHNARVARRIRGWPRVKANVVHWHEAGPYGKPFSRVGKREVIVISQDGTERSIRQFPNPENVYYAELAYIFDGRPYVAELAFDRPVIDSFELLINPEDPSDYLPHAPSLNFSHFLGALSLVFLYMAL